MFRRLYGLNYKPGPWCISPVERVLVDNISRLGAVTGGPPAATTAAAIAARLVGVIGLSIGNNPDKSKLEFFDTGRSKNAVRLWGLGQVSNEEPVAGFLPWIDMSFFWEAISLIPSRVSLLPWSSVANCRTSWFLKRNFKFNKTLFNLEMM